MLSLEAMFSRAKQHKAAGDLPATIQVYKSAISAFPTSANAEHNLAVALFDALQYEEALLHINAAIAKGVQSVQSTLVVARIQTALQDFPAAVDNYHKALTQDPVNFDAHRELAQLSWMLHGDSKESSKILELAIDKYPDNPALSHLYADLAYYVGDHERAFERIERANQKWDNFYPLLVSGAYKALHINNASKALFYAQKAVHTMQGEIDGWIVLCFAWLANENAEHALTAAHQACNIQPDNQEAIAVYALALRAQESGEYSALYDYANMVRKTQIATPKNWPNLNAYLADLRNELKAVHPYNTHPFGQSVRSGSQASNLLSVMTPAIQAFKEAIAPSIDAYIGKLGKGSDPLRKRIAQGWKIEGMWSVWLKPGGFHENHVHPQGWLSSACYIELPSEVQSNTGKDKAGWIQFGKPTYPATPHFPAEHTEKPKEGQLVLFPSYMWHGTIPFHGEDPRLTIAFDISPV